MRWVTFPVILCLAGAAQEARRPRILGVAHMALYVSDLAKARAFVHGAAAAVMAP